MATSASTAPNPDSPSPCRPGKCVVLVDDEKAYVDLLEQLLSEHLSCPVHCFTHPADALKALSDLNVGLIVTDYNMPKIDGLQFLAEIRNRIPGVPAVMITGCQETFTTQQLDRVPNLKMIIRKPFKWTTLVEQISKHWDGSQPPFPMNNR